jgi:hypothetical protein
MSTKRIIPYQPIDVTNPEYKTGIVALQALRRGDADELQQKRALDFIIVTLARTYELSYCSDPYDTAFAEGKRFVGGQIATLTNVNLGLLKKT